MDNIDNDLDGLAFRFFKLFAQYEWALKELGYVRAARNNGAALADWDAFAKATGGEVLVVGLTEVGEALDYIFGQPPRLQVHTNGRLAWQDVPGEERSAQALFGHIKRIRNNLYHGGKFNGRWFQPERSQELIRHALTILEALRQQNDEIRLALAGNVG